MTSRIFQHKQNLLTLHTQKGRGNIKLYLLTAWIIKYLISCWFSEDNFLHNEHICRKYLPWCHIKRMSLCHIFKILRPKFQKTLATSVLMTIMHYENYLWNKCTYSYKLYAIQEDHVSLEKLRGTAFSLIHQHDSSLWIWMTDILIIWLSTFKKRISGLLLVCKIDLTSLYFFLVHEDSSKCKNKRHRKQL